MGPIQTLLPSFLTGSSDDPIRTLILAMDIELSFPRIDSSRFVCCVRSDRGCGFDA